MDLKCFKSYRRGRRITIIILLCGLLSPLLFALRGDAQPFRIAFVGDIMVHAPQLEAARDGRDGTYDFSPQLAPMKRVLASADLVVGNLETTLAAGIRSFSGYPCFNTPDSLVSALADCGFSVLTTANNHCLDSRGRGAERTSEILDTMGLSRVGVRLGKDARIALEVEKNGIRLGFLSYTYGTNGITLSSNASIIVPTIQGADVADEIRNARKPETDLFVVGFHFGQEYSPKPSKDQRDVAALAFRAGTDIVIGTHPHVLQPVEISRNSRSGRIRVVAYSLGNFLSSQRTKPRDRSCVLFIDVEKRRTGVFITRVSILPIWTRWGRGNATPRIAVTPLVHEVRRLAGRRDPGGISEIRNLRAIEESVCRSLLVCHRAEPDGSYTLWKENQER
jgi:poly-gamma-glutamate capsule biosynthesis protein CapA/YwtB (metallophosphatase superfamily)